MAPGQDKQRGLVLQGYQGAGVCCQRQGEAATGGKGGGDSAVSDLAAVQAAEQSVPLLC